MKLMKSCISDDKDFLYVRVQNGAGYVANFTVTYTFNGKVYKLDSGLYTLGFSRELKVPKAANNIYVEVFYHFSVYAQCFCRINILKKRSICLYLYGTIFYPVCVKVHCHPVSINNYFNV